MQKPDEFLTYSVKFQNKTFDLLPEVLFAIIIHDLLKRIKRDFVIKNTQIELEDQNKLLLNRIKVSLNSNNLVDLEEDYDVDYDYTDQGDHLFEIIQKKETMENYLMVIERAKQIKPESREELNEIDFNKPNMFLEEEIIRTLAKKWSTKERSELKICWLDNYCLFITSKYFDDIQDHKNL